MQNIEDRKRLTNDASHFAEWLNSSNSDKEKIRATARADRSPNRDGGTLFERLLEREFARGLIRPLVEVTLDYLRKRQKQKRKSREVRFSTFERYIDDMAPLLNVIEKRYPTRPAVDDETFWTGRPAFIYELIPLDRHDRSELASGKADEVMERLNQFFRLGREGAFAAFRRCVLPKCGNYFYALRPERRYCSKACQRNHYMQHPLRPKKSAADQKVYYYAHKILDLGKVKDVNAANRREYLLAKKAENSARREQKALKKAIRADLQGH